MKLKHTPTLQVFNLVEMDEHYWDEVEKMQLAGNDTYDEVRLVRAVNKDAIVRAVTSHEAMKLALNALVNEVGEGSKAGKYLSANTWELIQHAIKQEEGR